MRERIAAIRGNSDAENDVLIAEMPCDRRPRLGCAVEHRDAGVIVVETEFRSRTDHAGGFDAAELSPVDGEAELFDISAHPCEDDLLPCTHVRSAADHRRGLIAVAHGADRELVRVGMLPAGEHLTHDNILEGISPIFNGFNLQANIG